MAVTLNFAHDGPGQVFIGFEPPLSDEDQNKVLDILGAEAKLVQHGDIATVAVVETGTSVIVPRGHVRRLGEKAVQVLAHAGTSAHVASREVPEIRASNYPWRSVATAA